jgi:hypothetical protein
MRKITAEEWELLSCFEVDPERADPSLPWDSDDSVYSVSDGLVSLSCAIHPLYRDVRIILKCSEQRIYELNSMGVDDVRVIKEADAEILEVVLTPEECIAVKIRPKILLEQRAEIET